MGVKVSAEYKRSTAFDVLIGRIVSPAMREAVRAGLNEHAAEQRLQSIVRVTAFTGIPQSRMASKTKVLPAIGETSMTAVVETKDQAIGLAEYGKPVWVRDLNPMADGQKGGSVSSMAGAEATAWNVRRVFKHAFIMNGRVVVRTGKGSFPVKTLYAAVLPNELAKPERPNVPAAERFAQLDLEQRVTRHILRFLEE